jgi:hypothetical protein
MNHSIEQSKLPLNYLKAVSIVVAMLSVSVLLWSYSMGGAKDLASAAVSQNSTDFKIKVSPPRPRIIDPISITISGVWANSCIPQNPEVRIDGKQIYITTSNPDRNCLTQLTPWGHKIDIGTLPAGTYQIIVSHISSTGEQLLGSAEFDVIPCFGC